MAWIKVFVSVVMMTLSYGLAFAQSADADDYVTEEKAIQEACPARVSFGYQIPAGQRYADMRADSTRMTRCTSVAEGKAIVAEEKALHEACPARVSFGYQIPAGHRYADMHADSTRMTRCTSVAEGKAIVAEEKALHEACPARVGFGYQIPAGHRYADMRAGSTRITRCTSVTEVKAAVAEDMTRLNAEQKRQHTKQQEEYDRQHRANGKLNASASDPEPEPEPEPEPDSSSPVQSAPRIQNQVKAYMEYAKPVPLIDVPKFQPISPITPNREINNNPQSTINQTPATLQPSTQHPISGAVTQPFGVPWSVKPWKTHTGIDIAASAGTLVPSVSAGTVVAIRNLGKEWGYAVVIREAGGSARGYLHVNPMVKESQEVVVGSKIGTVWKDHLHYNVCREVNLCWRGALPTDHKDTEYPNDPLFRNGPFLRP